jgi:hypothetical protein
LRAGPGPGNGPRRPRIIATGDTSAAFHEWITVVTERWWLVYFDRDLILKKPKTQSAGHPPLYLNFNLAIGGTWFGNVTSEIDFCRWEMNLKSIEIYSLPKGFNGDQELPLTKADDPGGGIVSPRPIKPAPVNAPCQALWLVRAVVSRPARPL